MSEQQRETAFFRYCLSYAASARRQELDAQLGQIQRDERCVQRAVWVLEVLVALIAAGLGYAVVLADNFPYDQPQITIGILSALGLAAISAAQNDLSPEAGTTAGGMPAVGHEVIGEPVGPAGGHGVAGNPTPSPGRSPLGTTRPGCNRRKPTLDVTVLKKVRARHIYLAGSRSNRGC